MVFGGRPSENESAQHPSFSGVGITQKLYDRESLITAAISLIAPMRIIYLAPRRALNARDAEFVEALRSHEDVTERTRQSVESSLN